MPIAGPFFLSESYPAYQITGGGKNPAKNPPLARLPRSRRATFFEYLNTYVRSFISNTNNIAPAAAPQLAVQATKVLPACVGNRQPNGLVARAMSWAG
jgi:hypothetical protein